MRLRKKFTLNWAKHQQRWFGKWHLYLGIFAGAIVAVVGITGSILVFREEIDAALNPALFKVLQQQHKIPVGDIVPMVQAKYPALNIDYIACEDDSPQATYEVFNYKTEEQVFINPYTGDMAGKRLYESGFISIVTDIHRTLLVPVVGRYIVGISSLILLILTISGLRLWIPQKWKLLKSVLTVNFKTSFKRQNYDWHNVLGFYSSPVVILLSLTGFCITFSIVVVPMLFILSGKSPQGVQQLLGAKSVYVNGAKVLPVKDIIAVGEKALPGSRVAGIAFPADSVGNYRLDIVSPGMPVSGKREMIILDQYSGKILVNSRVDFPQSGNAYLSWLGPVHYGSFGGLPTQIAALVGGLIPAALFVTGFIIWWPRYKKQKRKAKKEALKEEALTTERAPQKEPLLATISGVKYFLLNTKKGFRYALWCLLLSAVMGAGYGIFSGIVLQPAVFTIAFIAVLVITNFIIALPVFAINMLLFAPFKKGSRRVLRYFALSFSFAVVFFAGYMVLMNAGIRVF